MDGVCRMKMVYVIMRMVYRLKPRNQRTHRQSHTQVAASTNLLFVQTNIGNVAVFFSTDNAQRRRIQFSGFFYHKCSLETRASFRYFLFFFASNIDILVGITWHKLYFNIKSEEPNAFQRQKSD